MSVDYKRLADDDVGGELEPAFSTMSAMTVESTPEVMVTYRRISAAVSLAASAELEIGVLSPDSNIPSWVNASLSNDGIDVNDPQVNAVLASLVSVDTSAAISAMGVITEPKYTNFKVGHLANARQMRVEGRI